MKKLNETEIEYQIVHDYASLFKLGEKVFLKDKPDKPLTVIDIVDDLVVVSITRGHKHYVEPQSLLQYKYAGLVYWNNNEMCLN